MPVEVVELAETWRLSSRDRVTMQRLIESFVQALEQRLPQHLELVGVDVSVTNRVAPHDRRAHGEATG
jgi:hypothetical protein